MGVVHEPELERPAGRALQLLRERGHLRRRLTPAAALDRQHARLRGRLAAGLVSARAAARGEDEREGGNRPGRAPSAESSAGHRAPPVECIRRYARAEDPPSGRALDRSRQGSGIALVPIKGPHSRDAPAGVRRSSHACSAGLRRARHRPRRVLAGARAKRSGVLLREDVRARRAGAAGRRVRPGRLRPRLLGSAPVERCGAAARARRRRLVRGRVGHPWRQGGGVHARAAALRGVSGAGRLGDPRVSGRTAHLAPPACRGGRRTRRCAPRAGPAPRAGLRPGRRRLQRLPAQPPRGHRSAGRRRRAHPCRRPPRRRVVVAAARRSRRGGSSGRVPHGAACWRRSPSRNRVPRPRRLELRREPRPRVRRQRRPPAAALARAGGGALGPRRRRAVEPRTGTPHARPCRAAGGGAAARSPAPGVSPRRWRSSWGIRTSRSRTRSATAASWTRRAASSTSRTTTAVARRPSCARAGPSRC